jgi:hypothetical protein
MFGHAHRLRNAERMHKYYADWQNTKRASEQRPASPKVTPGLDLVMPELHEHPEGEQLLDPHSHGKPKWRVSRHMPLFGAISPHPAASQVARLPTPDTSVTASSPARPSPQLTAHDALANPVAPAAGQEWRVAKDGVAGFSRGAGAAGGMQLSMLVQTIKLDDEWPYILQGPASLSTYQEEKSREGKGSCRAQRRVEAGGPKHIGGGLASGGAAAPRPRAVKSKPHVASYRTRMAVSEQVF